MIVDIEQDGLKYKAQVPDGTPESMWNAGIIIGPPDLTSLGLPPSVKARLHNELYVRGLITVKDVRKRMHDVQGALQSALKVSASEIAELYR